MILAENHRKNESTKLCAVSPFATPEDDIIEREEDAIRKPHEKQTIPEYTSGSKYPPGNRSSRQRYPTNKRPTDFN
jgi:hypothetical protein